MPTTWYLVCPSRQLSANQPLPFRVEGERWVAFRDEQGQARMVEDRCAHRFAPLSAGKVVGGQIECPYHGWRYRGDGELACVPALGPQTPPACRVTSMRVLEQQGFVWATPELSSAGAPPWFRHYGEAGWTSFVMHSTFQASVEACLENFLDCPHATFVHRYWFRAPTAQPVRCVVRSLADGAEAEYFEEPRKQSAVWTLLAPAKGEMRHIDRFIAPATSQVEYHFPNGLSYLITSHCTPLDADETAVTTVISFRFARLGPLVRLFFQPLARHILQQDITMLAQVAQTGRPRQPALTTEADLLGPAIWRWRAALREGRPTPPAGEEKQVVIYL
ncbi:aromatic ring-hydroxylating oxygenase subunit alpha [Parachitinimonas caeni]|uniref:Aromatic ring-hydroxylating dioxygenase subunit alpha n=1 Tax=Parachitinimonas caeni TaxID=3031301 RepID=A0ABT7E3B9_9NEIS|nr:aromatic ring-hydroxylating dioxygenase subunit alpha [Parachitinimonas caeni]MDK2125813.1 aromatic ring-hydroxylating dioxygenase subunit alpha [Parachitinimonas caeni]